MSALCILLRMDLECLVVRLFQSSKEVALDHKCGLHEDPVKLRLCHNPLVLKAYNCRPGDALNESINCNVLHASQIYIYYIHTNL